MTSTTQITFTTTAHGLFAAHLVLAQHRAVLAKTSDSDLAAAITAAADEFHTVALRCAQRSVTATVTVAREHFAEMLAIVKDDYRAQADPHFKRFLADADAATFTHAITATI